MQVTLSLTPEIPTNKRMISAQNHLLALIWLIEM